MNKWISVEDRLPEVKPCDDYDDYMSSEPVLAYFDPATNEQPWDILMYQCGENDDGTSWAAWFIASLQDDCHPPLYWMPLPAPPEGI